MFVSQCAEIFYEYPSLINIYGGQDDQRKESRKVFKCPFLIFFGYPGLLAFLLALPWTSYQSITLYLKKKLAMSSPSSHGNIAYNLALEGLMNKIFPGTHVLSVCICGWQFAWI